MQLYSHVASLAATVCRVERQNDSRHSKLMAGIVDAALGREFCNVLRKTGGFLIFKYIFVIFSMPFIKHQLAYDNIEYKKKFALKDHNNEFKSEHRIESFDPMFRLEFIIVVLKGNFFFYIQYYHKQVDAL